MRILLLLLVLLASPAFAHHSDGVPTTTNSPDGMIMIFRDEDGIRLGLPGADKFCERHPRDCRSVRYDKRIKLTVQSYQEIAEINHAVNTEIAYTSDSTNYGELEHWAYPTNGRGDCEDYVLEKRKRLIAAGYPPQALVAAWVKWMWQDHAVLLVRTDHGDFVLDDANPDIVAWTWKTYVFKAKQAWFDPKLWINMDDADPNPLGRWAIFLIL